MKKIFGLAATFCGKGWLWPTAALQITLLPKQTFIRGACKCWLGGWFLLVAGCSPGWEVKEVGWWVDCCRTHFSIGSAARLLIGAKINWKCWSIALLAAQLEWSLGIGGAGGTQSALLVLWITARGGVPVGGASHGPDYNPPPGCSHGISNYYLLLLYC